MTNESEEIEMSQTVLIPAGLEPISRQILERAGLNVVEVPMVTSEQFHKYADNLLGAIIRMEQVDNEVYDACPHLKILARIGVGYDNIDYQTAAAHGVYTTITPHSNAVTVAEAILGSILMLSRDVLQRSRDLRAGNWSQGAATAGHDIQGQTLGIIGYGRIGHELAQRAHALGMKILINNGHHHKDSEFGQSVSLDDLLSQSDYVSLNAPVTPETKGLINAESISKMKPSASIINFGRGALINTDDLVAALKTNRLHSAALDVFDPEPIAMDSPLLQLDNVILTPHIGGGTIDAMARACHDAAEEIVRVAQGQEPNWPVTPLK